jgi:hypothetical protein
MLSRGNFKGAGQITDYLEWRVRVVTVRLALPLFPERGTILELESK